VDRFFYGQLWRKSEQIHKPYVLCEEVALNATLARSTMVIQKRIFFGRYFLRLLATNARAFLRFNPAAFMSRFENLKRFVATLDRK